MCWAIENRGQWEQGCSLSMATDLGPVKATRKKEKKKKNLILLAGDDVPISVEFHGS